MPNDKAKFYYRSYCDKDVTGYTLSGDYTTVANAVDRNKLTYTTTDGYDTDGTSADFIVDMDYERECDTLVLKSNLKTFTVYIWDENETGTGGANYIELQSYASNTDEFILLEFPTEYTSKIKITATHTITADEEKQIYLFEITKKIDEMYLEGVKIDKKWESVEFTNLYGGSIRVIKYPNHGKVTVNLKWDNMTGDDYTAYKALKDRILIDAFNCYFYFSDTYDLLNVEAYYLMNDVSDMKSTPTSPALPAGVSGEMKLLEC